MIEFLQIALSIGCCFGGAVLLAAVMSNGLGHGEGDDL